MVRKGGPSPWQARLNVAYDGMRGAIARMTDRDGSLAAEEIVVLFGLINVELKKHARHGRPQYIVEEMRPGSIFRAVGTPVAEPVVGELEEPDVYEGVDMEFGQP